MARRFFMQKRKNEKKKFYLLKVTGKKECDWLQQKGQSSSANRGKIFLLHVFQIGFVAHPGCHDLPLGGNMAGVYR
jgi:hypothetical protein